MKDEDISKCPFFDLECVRRSNNDKTSDRMPRHGGVTKLPVCNHPDFPKPHSRILAPLRCNGEVPEKCEVESFKEIYSPE